MSKPFKIFVSSPGDVAREKLRVTNVVEKLAHKYSRYFTFESYRWEHEAMLASEHFQDIIELPSTFDVVVLILWSRLGTPLPKKTAKREYRGIDGRAPVRGTEWEFEEALAATQNTGAPDLLAFRNISDAPIKTHDRAARSRTEKQLRALDDFWRRHFEDKGQFTAAFRTYETIEEFSQLFELSLAKLIEKRIKERPDGGSSAPVWLSDPFRGLDSYEFKDAPIYFGRDAAATKATEQLAENARAGCAFLLICGASGSGKSSLVKAGILPRLMKPPGIEGLAFARRVVFRPAAEGTDVFVGLARALTHGDGADVGLPELAPHQDTAQLAAHLRSTAGNPGFLFANALGQVTRAGHKSGGIPEFAAARLILVVDQLEELFTMGGLRVEDRRLFIELLAGLARSGSVWVVATMRNDYWPRAIEDVGELAALAEKMGRLDLAKPSVAELTEMIRLPAAAAGLSFKPHPHSKIGLDAVLIEDAAAAPGALPLLSFVLKALADESKKAGTTELVHASYEQLGGLRGAIAARADEILQTLPAESQATLPRVLRALSTLSDDAKTPSARVAALENFAEGSSERALIDAFVKARLFVSDNGAGRANAGTIRVAHEALLTHWTTARDHIEKDRVNLQVRSRLESAAALWRVNRDDSRLLAAGEPLAEAVKLMNEHAGEISAHVLEFIERSNERALLRDAGFRYKDWSAKAEREQLALLRDSPTPVDPNAPEERLNRAERLIGLAQYGTTTLAERQATAERALAMLSDLTKATPDQWRPRHLLAMCHFTLGELAAAAGDRTKARAGYRAATATLDEGDIAEAYKDEAQRMHAVMRTREADLLLQEGKTREVLNAYRESLSAQESLIERNPDKSEWREDLCRLHGAISDVQLRQGELADAIVSCERALSAAQLLSWLSLGRPAFQITLARLHGAIAWARHNQDQSNPDNIESALAAYARARTVIQTLSEIYPGHTPYRRELAMVAVRIGGHLSQRGRTGDALRVCHGALELLRQLAEKDKSDLHLQRDLATALHKLGDVTLQANPAAALDAYLECKTIRKTVQQQDAANTDWLFELSFTDEKIAQALAGLEKFSEAVAMLQQGLAMAEEACKAAADNPARRDQIAFLRSSLAEIHRRAGQVEHAAAEYRNALNLRKRLVDEQPENPLWIRETLYSHIRLADVLDPDKARAELNQALAHSRTLIRLEGSFKARDEAATIEKKLAALAN